MRRRSRVGRGRGVAAAGFAVLLLAGCTESAAPPPDPLQRAPGQMYFYGSDGNMLNGVGDLVTAVRPDAIAGMKGTTPLTQLTQSFRNRVRSVDRTIVDDAYTGETYDAVVISALAAEIAGSTNSRAIAAQINGVTVGGQPCDQPQQCLTLIRAGEDIRYRGVTLGLGGFTDAGEPSASFYGILRFGAGNRLADGLTEFVPTGDPAKASQATPPRPGGANTQPLRIGALLPHTGALASAGPPMFAAGQLAVREINDAGGILGRPVEWVDGDDGTNGDVAAATVRRLIQQENVQVIIGAGASGVSLAVLPIVVEAGVVLFSPCNTADVLTGFDDQGLYFRTAPPDALQATALADIIVGDGSRRLAFIYRDDAYGAGLAEATRQQLIGAGLVADEIKMYPYSAEVADEWVGDRENTDLLAQLGFAETARIVRQSNPDGVVLINFDETSGVVDALVNAGITSITN
jgi:ABC-type branched-subunit amino acid transport system substrate-binding protein